MMREGTMQGSPSTGNSNCKGLEAEAFLKKEKEDWYS